MTHTPTPTAEKKSNRKKKLIAAILLFLLLALGFLAFLFLQTPEKVTAPAPKPSPVHIETEQEKWVANLTALEALPIPTFTCSDFIMMDQTITLYDGRVTTVQNEAPTEDSTFYFIKSPTTPTHEQLFPDKTNGVFERCILNVAVPYVEEMREGETVLSPDRSSIPAAVAPYGYEETSETDEYAVDGVIWASTRMYETTDTMADVFKSEIEYSSTFRDGITVITKAHSITTRESDVISIAFSADEDLANFSAAQMLEFRSQVSEEQYKVLNAFAAEVL